MQESTTIDNHQTQVLLLLDTLGFWPMFWLWRTLVKYSSCEHLSQQICRAPTFNFFFGENIAIFKGSAAVKPSQIHQRCGQQDVNFTSTWKLWLSYFFNVRWEQSCTPKLQLHSSLLQIVTGSEHFRPNWSSSVSKSASSNSSLLATLSKSSNFSTYMRITILFF